MYACMHGLTCDSEGDAAGSQCCGHFHAYIKRTKGQLFSGCPSFNPHADVQLTGLYTMPGATRSHVRTT